MKAFVLIQFLSLAVVSTGFAAPTTQPATLCDVLVMPFQSLADSNDQSHLGRAMQETLVADLGHGQFHPAKASETSSDAAAAGRALGATYVIEGNWQSSDDQLRFTAQIIETDTGSIVGGLKASGSAHELFSLEDSLSTQATRQLHRLLNPSTAAESNAIPPAMIIPIAPTALAAYRPSRLETELNSYRTTANDYTYQYQTTAQRQTYQYDYGDSYNGYCGIGYALPYFTNLSSRYTGRHLPLR